MNKDKIKERMNGYAPDQLVGVEQATIGQTISELRKVDKQSLIGFLTTIIGALDVAAGRKTPESTGITETDVRSFAKVGGITARLQRLDSIGEQIREEQARRSQDSEQG